MDISEMMKSYDVSPDLMLAFEDYWRLTALWGKKFNITKHMSRDSFFHRNILDNVAAFCAVASGIDQSKHEFGADFGCGGGFTGIVWALLNPKWHIELVDDHRKRISFCKTVISTLKIPNCTATHSRAEDYIMSHKKHLDFAVSRATWDFDLYRSIVWDGLKEGGSLYSYESRHITLPNGVDGKVFN